MNLVWVITQNMLPPYKNVTGEDFTTYQMALEKVQLKKYLKKFSHDGY
jgi:hypothetical protein